ncbi:endospore germination permease [Ammoniphilus sp. YIM 78166]|uniref:GerAB/ArcD/ProY family transporter n=1 Tax=Ammoniphilus sp. YIM 78166 TaxID=1644106 RepID=UPI001F0E0736|nr:endospore germination permease [Ammoniphilus sp. YIM 78166]
MERGRISSLQMALLMYTNIIATAILMVPSITFRYAERDLWLPPIFASVIGFLAVFLACKLHDMYPNQTFIQYGEQIIGRVLGKGLGFVFSFYFIFICGIVLRQYGEFLVGSFLSQTPLLVIMGSMALVCALAVRGGLEAISRLSDMFVPILFLLWLTLVILLIPEFELRNLLPVMEKGITPSLLAAVVPQAWYTMFFFMSFLLPFLSDQKQGLKWGFYSVLAVMATLVITNLATLLLFGNITGNFLYPVMSASRYIGYADFFENLESVVMAIWIGGSFIKLGIMYYITVLCTAQCLELSDYKLLSLPIGLLTTMMGVWAFPNVSEMSHYFSTVSAFVQPTYFIVIPACLLFIALLRERFSPKGTR